MVSIYGFQKTTLLDYPGHLASTIFLGHCNLRCPYCHNSSLISPTSRMTCYDVEEILGHLKKRINILEGVCITGGEPTLYNNLPSFLYTIKQLGYRIKLDTNGTNPTMLTELIQDQLIDYVAMDIKNAPNKYATTCGLPTFSLDPILESIHLLTDSTIDYEFRTTVVKEYHNLEDLLELASLLPRDCLYYLQNYRDSDGVATANLHGIDTDTLHNYLNKIKQLLPNSHIRGEQDD